MAEFEPDPSETALADERETWTESQDTRQRIRSVVMGLREPTTAAEIADRAACSTNAARKHLKEFLDMGVVREAAGSDGTRYVRNEAYIRWRRANELATTHTVDALLDRLEDLQRRDEQFRTQFDAPVPEDVELPEEATHAELEERLEAVSEWATVRESIDRHREALRIARTEDGRLTA